DIENPEDRCVSITLQATPTESCPPDALLRASTVLTVRFGCLTRDEVSVVIADQSQTPTIFRTFVWKKLLAVPAGCEFFPDLDPTVTSAILLSTPARLAQTPDADAPSDFDDTAIVRSSPFGLILLHEIELESHGEVSKVVFPGTWHPATCEAAPAAGNTLATIGRLKPNGPVQCGPMPLPKSVPCPKPPKKDKCTDACRESTASKFKATTES